MTIRQPSSQFQPWPVTFKSRMKECHRLVKNVMKLHRQDRREKCKLKIMDPKADVMDADMYKPRSKSVTKEIDSRVWP